MEAFIKNLLTQKIDQDALTRDLFALLVVWRFTEDPEGEKLPDIDLGAGGWSELATISYAFADLMMKERAKGMVKK